MFDKLSCEDTAAAAVHEAYEEAHCETPASEDFCSDLCRDEADGLVDEG